MKHPNIKHIFSQNDLQAFMSLSPDERDKMLYIYMIQTNNNIKMIKYMLSIVIATTFPVAIAVFAKLVL